MYRDLVSLVKEVEASRKRKFEELLSKLCQEAIAVALFGSRARGDHTPLSDWDILAIIGGGQYKIEVVSIGQIVWLPLDNVGECIRKSMILLDALIDAKLICGNDEALNRARNEAMRYIEEAKLKRTRLGWVPRND